MKRKFYYIDNDGNKKKYVGHIISNPDGSYSGILTHREKTKDEVEVIYNEAVEEVKEVSEHYSYINEFGEDTWYNGNVKYSGTKPYFTYTSTTIYDLTYYPAGQTENVYYTYTLDGIQHVYLGDVEYNSITDTYIGRRQ